MNRVLAVCLIVLSADFASDASAQEKPTLRLVQTIPLPGVKGRLDHMCIDLEKKRLFVAAARNNSLEVVDLTVGEQDTSLTRVDDNPRTLPLVVAPTHLYLVA